MANAIVSKLTHSQKKPRRSGASLITAWVSALEPVLSVQAPELASSAKP